MAFRMPFRVMIITMNGWFDKRINAEVLKGYYKRIYRKYSVLSILLFTMRGLKAIIRCLFTRKPNLLIFLGWNLVITRR